MLLEMHTRDYASLMLGIILGEKEKDFFLSPQQNISLYGPT